jgi:geranylgeranyl diphosphate synthase type I
MGKRLRPILLLLTCEAQGGDWRQALPAASAVELLHNFTLIHDDIEDHDRTRRGRDTLWVLWGEAQAINAGDALFTLAYRALLGSIEAGVPPERVLRMTHRYTETILRITEGQCMDLAFEADAAVDEGRYLQMIEGKTAALIALACELGGIVAGAPAARLTALGAFGRALGMAFQIQDDLLGLWGDPARTGKPVGADLLRHKKTLPILHGLHHSTAFGELFAQASLDADAVERALGLLETAGSHAYAEDQARSYHQAAREALERAQGAGEAHETLRALLKQLLHRDT